MAYATLEQLQKRAGVVYERIYEDGADASDDIAEAAAEIDGCLSKRYIVPVTAEASLQLLKGWNLTLAEERMYARGGAAKLSESDSARIAKVREYLMMAMDGRFILPGAAENPETGGADVSLSMGTRRSSRAKNSEDTDMRKLSEIADDLKTLLSGKFGAVIVTTAQLDNQLQQELRSFGKHAFPAVIIAVGQGDYTNENTLREINIALVLVDSFCPGSSERSAALLESLETMIALFSEGLDLNGVFYIPTEFYPASADATYVCYALTLKAKQGI